nr:hypothetical protein [Tanacetum cinerariifolium]
MSNIPYEAWTAIGISALASRIGKPLIMDVVTDDMCQAGMAINSFARVLVKVNAHKELHNKIGVAYKNKKNEIISTKMIQVSYNWKPHRCENCKVFGHSNDGCPKSTKNKVNNDDVGRSETNVSKSFERFTNVTNKKVGKQRNRRGQGNNDQHNNHDDVGSFKQKENSKKGMCTSDKQREVAKFISEDNLQVCSTLETHIKSKKLIKACEKAFSNWDWISNVHLCNKGCRIIIRWNMDMVIEHDRRNLWADLNRHKPIADGKPWFMGGDMNVILNTIEHSSWVSFVSNYMQEFKDCVNMIEVEDPCSSGLFFIWTKNLKKAREDNDTCVLKKLDKVMINEDFMKKFDKARVNFKSYLVSDHNQAVVIIPYGMEKKKKRAFKFANYIADKDNFIPTNGNFFNKVEELRNQQTIFVRSIPRCPKRGEHTSRGSLDIVDFFLSSTSKQAFPGSYPNETCQ